MKQTRLAALALSCMLLCCGCGNSNDTAATANQDAQSTESSATIITDANAETAAESVAETTTPPPVESTTETTPETTAEVITEPAADVAEPIQSSQPMIEVSPYQTVMIQGSFTATVRALMPDYVTDGTTVNSAVLQLFQDGPFFTRLTPEICAQLTVGETYTFLVKEQEINAPKTNLGDNNYLSSDQIRARWVEIDSVRAPQEDEIGLDCWNVTYSIVS